jgi:DNA-binding LacI/PurR family transcriptional regulator
MSLNLSTSPVSLVLNASAGAEGIPAVTRERILAAALAQAITDTLRMAGYDVLLATHHRRPDLIAARARLMLERQVGVAGAASRAGSWGIGRRGDTTRR